MERRASRPSAEELENTKIDATTPKLRIRLRPGWHPAENPAIPTCKRTASADSGILQFSVAQFRPGTGPNATEQTLIAICEKLTSGVRGPRDVSSTSGTCDFGIYGTVAIHGDSPTRFQAWVVSNGQEFILVTHTCGSAPDPEEVREANEIALMTGFG
jgi:hypothetical protein